MLKRLLGPARPIVGKLAHRAAIEFYRRAGTFRNMWVTYDDAALTDGIGAEATLDAMKPKKTTAR